MSTRYGPGWRAHPLHPEPDDPPPTLPAGTACVNEAAGSVDLSTLGLPQPFSTSRGRTHAVHRPPPPGSAGPPSHFSTMNCGPHPSPRGILSSTRGRDRMADIELRETCAHARTRVRSACTLPPPPAPHTHTGYLLMLVTQRPLRAVRSRASSPPSSLLFLPGKQQPSVPRPI